MFDQSVHDAFIAHGTEAYPKEACGLVVSTGGQSNYLRCDNVAPDPEKDFAIRPEDFAAAEVEGTEVVAVLHSHPAKTLRHELAASAPSGLDQQNQMNSGLPWGIGVSIEGGCSVPHYFGDQVPTAPLIGPPFRHGVWDCYSLVRDYYAEKGLKIRNYPRDLEWWDEGKTLYLDSFRDEGFIEIQEEELREGDGFLASVRSETSNHSGIYLGDGTIMHHLMWHLSLREASHRWRPLITHWLRHPEINK